MLNTFMKRHHLRLWRTTVTTADGREIWLGASTHDIGLDVHLGVVSHAIDPDLDAERGKVGADLMAGGLVAAEQLVTRPNPLSEGKTATGGTWKTDGQMLVIELKTSAPCEELFDALPRLDVCFLAEEPILRSLQVRALSVRSTMASTPAIPDRGCPARRR